MKEQITTSQWEENVTGFARETRFAESQLALMLNLIGLVAIRRENLEWCSALWKIKRQKRNPPSEGTKYMFGKKDKLNRNNKEPTWNTIG